MDVAGFGFWEARETGAAAVIGSDKAETPRSLRRLFRHVLRARLLRDLTGLPGPTSQPLGSGPL